MSGSPYPCQPYSSRLDAVDAALSVVGNSFQPAFSNNTNGAQEFSVLRDNGDGYAGFRFRSSSTANGLPTLSMLGSAEEFTIGQDASTFRLDRFGVQLGAGSTSLNLTNSGIGITGNITMPSGSVLTTGAAGAGTFTINNDGNSRWQFIANEFSASGIIRPATTNLRSLGTSLFRWSTVFGVNGDFSGNLTASGTVIGDTLMVGGASGPQWRNNGGTIESRNNANNALVNLNVGQVTCTSVRTNVVQRDSGDTTMVLYNGNFGVAGFCMRGPSGSYVNSSGVTGSLNLNPTINQTGTAGSTDFEITRTETALGSGTHNFIRCVRNSTFAFAVDRLGNVSSAGSITASGQAASLGVIISDNPSVSAGSGGTGELRLFTGSGASWVGRMNASNLDVGNGFAMRWHPGGLIATSDTSISKNAPGVIQFGSGATSNANGSILFANATASGNAVFGSGSSFPIGIGQDAGRGGYLASTVAGTTYGLSFSSANSIFPCSGTAPVTNIVSLGRADYQFLNVFSQNLNAVAATIANNATRSSNLVSMSSAFNIGNGNSVLSIGYTGADMGRALSVSSASFTTGAMTIAQTTSANASNTNVSGLSVTGTFQHTDAGGATSIGNGGRFVATNTTASSGTLFGLDVLATTNAANVTGLRVTAATTSGTAIAIDAVGSIQTSGTLGWSDVRMPRVLKTLQTQCFESTLSAWQETSRQEASATGARWSCLGATPIVRQTLPAAATDAATTQALANSIRSLLINFGFAN